jgi:uncharacterized membrane protein
MEAQPITRVVADKANEKSVLWNRLYGLKTYLTSSLWIVPFIAIPFALVTARGLRWLDPKLGWSLLNFSAAGADAALQTIVTATLSFVVFTFGSLLVAIQVASSQLTARIIATTLLRDTVIKYTVGLFIFTLLFSLSAQNRIGNSVPQLVVLVATCLGIMCFAAFFYLIDYASRLLRPISILARVGRYGLAVIESVYPHKTYSLNQPRSQLEKLIPPDRLIQHKGTSGIVLAVNLDAVLAEAQRSNCIIEFVPQVGDFVAVDEPLFHVFGDTGTISEDVLFTSVAFGSERTMEQDPTFAFRIAVDIALRALSPAINDPTTAVLCIDQLHRMLRAVGLRDLRADQILDASGNVRIIFRTPNWEDFVHLACREIRYYGSNNLQIARRLRAMIQNLIQTLPDYRHLALLTELSMLDRDIAQHFKYPEDLALAQIPDSQGLGGHSGIIQG